MEFPNAEIQLSWPPSPGIFEPTGREVHVWSTQLFRPGLDYAARLEALSADERQRAARFHFERDRHDFIARRFFLRVILGRYLKIEPAQIELVNEERGKPRLAGAADTVPLYFNLSHSRHLALLAVSRACPVGVDVEKVRPMPELDEIGANFFSLPENALLAAAGAEQKLAAFFSVWTRKEAFLKATGEGIAVQLGQVDCSQAPPGWTVQSLSPAPGFIGALALQTADATPLCWQWAE